MIKILAESGLISHQHLIAHFHEWLCGAGVLYLKKQCSKVATVFTTHATVLGRALSQENRLIGGLLTNFDPEAEARRLGVFAKHSLEKASVREADCFTTVSSITAHEANIVLSKYPDRIIFNGLDIETARKKIVSSNHQEIRLKLLAIASQVVGQKIDDHALLWLTSGRYEFHNKGYDLLVKSLAQLEHSLTKDAPPIVVFFLVAANWHSNKDSLLVIHQAAWSDQDRALGLATHQIYHADSDPMIKLCNELNFKKPERKIHIVFSDAYLYGSDGVFDLSYAQLISSCDLSIFPSCYEPWGYTPLESITYGTPPLLLI